MSRSFLALALLAACVPDTEPELAAAAHELSATRELVAGDVYRYGFDLRVGGGPNAVLHISRVVRERAPWLPRRTRDAVMMLHGDFSTFGTNFEQLAPWLAERNVDVWGLDQRWAHAPLDVDLSDFDAMDLAQELDDITIALAFARANRLATDGSIEQLSLIGFSRGGQLAYFYASHEAVRPAWQRHVKGIVPLDVYASLAPADEDQRLFACELAVAEYQALADGFVDVPNDFQSTVGQLALDAPDAPSPFNPARTNREVMLNFTGRTYRFFPATPLYHLAAPVLDATGFPSGLRESSETTIAEWLAAAAPHQSMRESADTDALVCGDAPLPLDVPLSRIRVPVFLIAAAGGYGERALHSTTQVSSTDVTTLVIRQLPPEREAEDFGHADLLFAPSAPALAWQPLLSWLRHH